MPKPLEANDAFFVDIRVDLKSVVGDRLVTLGNELQGIVVAIEDSPVRETPDKPQFHRVTAIPAVHVVKLIDDYRKANSREPAETDRPRATKTNKGTSQRAKPKSLDE